MRSLFKNRFFILTCSLMLTVLFAGCEPDDPVENPDPSGEGNYTVCSYTSGLYDSGYLDAEVFYPCETGDGPFAATTMTSGYTGTYSAMSWATEPIVTHGFIVIAMTPNNIYGYNSDWQEAHNAGIAKLKSENTRSSSPIYGLVKTDSLCIIGHSKGGGGTLLAADDQGSNVKAAIALAPYMDFSYDLSNIKAATQIQCGTLDTIALPGLAVDMYESLPTSVDRLLAYFSGPDHLDWATGGSYQSRFLTYMISWMKVYLDNNTAYEEYLDGSQSWFYQYEYLEAGEGDDGGCY